MYEDAGKFMSNDQISFINLKCTILENNANVNTVPE